MKSGIHPAYEQVNVVCHPFFTGKQKLIDTAGRIDRFERKYAAQRGDKKAATQN